MMEALVADLEINPDDWKIADKKSREKIAQELNNLILEVDNSISKICDKRDSDYDVERDKIWGEIQKRIFEKFPKVEDREKFAAYHIMGGSSEYFDCEFFDFDGDLSIKKYFQKVSVGLKNQATFNS